MDAAAAGKMVSPAPLRLRLQHVWMRLRRFVLGFSCYGGISVEARMLFDSQCNSCLFE